MGTWGGGSGQLPHPEAPKPETKNLSSPKTLGLESPNVYKGSMLKLILASGTIALEHNIARKT